MELHEIENKIARNEMTAAQVFTQMKQHIPQEITPRCLLYIDPAKSCQALKDRTKELEA